MKINLLYVFAHNS